MCFVKVVYSVINLISSPPLRHSFLHRWCYQCQNVNANRVQVRTDRAAPGLIVRRAKGRMLKPERWQQCCCWHCIGYWSRDSFPWLGRVRAVLCWRHTEDCKSLCKLWSIWVSCDVHSKWMLLLILLFSPDTWTSNLRAHMTKNNTPKVYPMTCVMMGANPASLVKP